MNRSRILLVSGLGLLALLVLLWNPADHSEPQEEVATVEPDENVESAQEQPDAAALADVKVDTTTEFDVEANTIPDPVDLDSADRDLDLFGIVLDPGGQPVAGALIETMALPWRRVSVLNVKGYWDRVAGPFTRSASDGTFSIRLSRGEIVNLEVSATEYARAVLPGCLAGERVRVELQDPANLEVNVTDEAGTPVSDARVRIWRRDATLARSSTFGEFRGVTDADGQFVFRDIQTGPGSLEVEHDVLGDPSWVQFDISEPGTEHISVTLPTGRTITGHVRDALTKEPIADATVGANWVLDRPTITNEDGYYEFRGWTGRGVHDLHVVAEGYGRTRLIVSDAEVVDFALTQGDSLSARILGPNGEPIVDAFVTAMGTQRVQGEQAIDTRSTRSESDGSVRLTSLRVDLPHTLIIQAEGYGRTLLDFDHAMSVDGIIDLGDITIPAGRWIEGVARYENGETIPYETVSISGHNKDRGRLRPLAKEFAFSAFYGTTETRFTDDLGRFRFPDLSPGSYKLRLQIRGRPDVIEEVVLGASADLMDVELRVTKGESVTILVEDQTGAPVRDARLWTQDRNRVSARTNLQGVAQFQGLPRGKISIGVWAGPDYAQAPSTDLVPNGQTVRIVVERATTIEGVVLSGDGEPLPRMQVIATYGDESQPRRVYAYSGSDGSFLVKVPAAVSVDLDLQGARRSNDSPMSSITEKTNWRGRLDDLISPQTDVELIAHEIVLDRQLTIRLLDVDGQPVPSVSVTLTGSANQPGLPPETDDEGIVRFENLPSSQVTVTVFPTRSALSDGQIPPAPERIVPDGQIVDLHFRQGTAVGGRVLDRDGAGIRRAMVIARADDGTVTFANADENGDFVISIVSGSVVSLESTLQGADGIRKTARRSEVDEHSTEVVLQFD